MSLLLSVAVCAVLATPFPWFMTAGAKTFERDKVGGAGSTLGEISFLSGAGVILWMGLLHGVPVARAIIAAALGALAIVLYEWTRRTVLGLGLSIGLSGQVPDVICEAGPYRLMRHPFYTSYVIAFVEVIVAVPTKLSAVVCALNVILFVYMAWDDERALADSGLAARYVAYQQRVGMFLLVPRRRD